MSHLSYVEAVVVGAFQGVTELFPVSSLGHSVLIPALIGGQWARDLDVSAAASPYLAFIVGLHVATAAALVLFFWRDWVQIVRGLGTSVMNRRIETPYERLGWLLVAATIPVGLAGLALDHVFRTTLGKPIPAAVFLIINGLVLAGAEWLRRQEPVAVGSRARHREMAGDPGHPGLTMASAAGSDPDADVRLSQLSTTNAVLIGCAQILALLPGISRSGSTMVAGLLRGLSHREAARFSFLLATPVILAAGALKLKDLTGPEGADIHGPILAGSAASFVSAYIAVRYLTRYFETRTLTPFAIYCVVVGGASLLWLTLG